MSDFYHFEQTHFRRRLFSTLLKMLTMDSYFMLLLLICTATLSSAVQTPFHSIRSPHNRGPAVTNTRHLHSPKSIPVYEHEEEVPAWDRPKRNHHDFDDYHHNNNNNNNNNGGVTGPVHTFVKTDKNANYKWGVRHHVGPKYV